MITSNITTKKEYLIHPKLIAADAINVIIRGEISAVEAYNQVIKKISGDPEHKRLLEFLSWHENAVEYWTKQVEAKKIESDESSGLWGVVVEAFIGTAKLLGSTRALQALKKGEEHGLQEYRNLLGNEFVSAENKRYVTNIVIPKLEMHIASIEAMSKIQ